MTQDRLEHVRAARKELDDVIDEIRAIDGYAVEASRTVVRGTRDDDPRLSARQMSLGSIYRLRYARGADPDDLERSIDLYARALAALGTVTPDGPAVDGTVLGDWAVVDGPYALRAALLNNLAVALSDRHELTGELADLHAAIGTAEQAVAASEPGSADRVMYISNLASHVADRFDRFGDVGDLDRAIGLLEATSTDSAATADLNNNLAGFYAKKYRHTNDPAVLDLGVSSAEAAVALAGKSSPALPGYLNNLGNALRLRFGRHFLANVEDLGESIEVSDLMFAVTAFRVALDLAGVDSALHLKIKTNLGTAMVTLSGLTGARHDLDEAVDMLEAAAVDSAGSANLAGRLNLLATALVARHRRDGAVADAVAATDAFRRGCALGVRVATEGTLAIACNWGDWAAWCESWIEAAEAYGVALNSLDRLYRIQPARAYKETWLRAGEGVAARAAYAMVMSGDERAAVTGLDRGRALLLAEALERGRADLARLADHDPAVVGRYYAAAQALEQLEAADL